MSGRPFFDTNVLVYSEDLQHDQIIDGTLSIHNPFGPR